MVAPPAAGPAALARHRRRPRSSSREALRGAAPTPAHADGRPRQQLDDALDALAAALRGARRVAADGRARLAALAPHAATIVDIARTLARARTRRRRRRRAARLDGGALRDAIDEPRARPRRCRRRRSRAGSRALAPTAPGDGRRDGLRLPPRPERKLLSIGYRVADGTLDPSCYDLLASEARLASFVAIAKGDVPRGTGSASGAPLTPVGRGAALISWSGSMFEYLMPSLVMRAPAGSLLEQTSRLVVRAADRLRRRARRAVGRLGVGLQRARPRAHLSVLELRRAGPRPEARARRERRHRALRDGARGDGRSARRGARTSRASPRPARAAATASTRRSTTRAPRLPEGDDGRDRARLHGAPPGHDARRASPTRCSTGAMRARFHAEPIVQATELLLQERTPRDVAVAHPRAEEVEAAATVRELELPAVRPLPLRRTTPRRATHLLSNGRYAVMLTAAGSGYSRWRDLAVTRWREDATRDDWGTYVFLRDVAERRGLVGRLPAERRRAGQLRGRRSPRTAPSSSGATARSRRRSRSSSRRRTTPRSAASRSTNRGSRGARDRAHLLRRARARAAGRRRGAPGLLEAVRADRVSSPELGALLATRRPRSPERARVWAAHLAVVEGETRRRAADTRPTARASSAAAASVRDADRGDRRPAALRTRSAPCSTRSSACAAACAIPPGATARVAFWTLVASVARRSCSTSPTSITTATAFERAATLAWTQAQVQLRHLGIEPDEATSSSASPAACSTPIPRCGRRRTRSAAAPAASPALWAHGISGDLPIVLVRIDDVEDIAHRPPAAARARVLAHEAARGRSRDPERARRRPTSRTSRSRSRRWCGPASRGRSSATDAGAAARVFVLRADLMLAEARDAAPVGGARRARRPPRHARRAARPRSQRRRAAAPPPRRARRRAGAAAGRAAAPELEFFNGLGGFAADGREYVTILGAGQWTPAPWINVVANPGFGFQVVGGGQRLHLGGQQPREPAHAVVERSGQRPAGRGRLRARRGDAASSGGRPRCRSATRPAPTSPGTARATAASSTPRTASRSSCCSSCRSTIRSRSRA